MFPAAGIWFSFKKLAACRLLRRKEGHVQVTSTEAKPAADGILPVQELNACFKKGFISSATELASDQIQPASLDLRLGRRAWRIQASFLPGMNQTVQDKIEKFAPIKYILKNQSDDSQKIIELLEDISRDLMNYDLEYRIQDLESKLSVDMSETTFNELKELKKKQNIN